MRRATILSFRPESRGAGSRIIKGIDKYLPEDKFGEYPVSITLSPFELLEILKFLTQYQF
jgi:hypothetical protein